MSWAHQRSRELADQILDDAQTFRQRLANGGDAVRRAGLVFVDTVADLPGACRERLVALARGLARAGSNTAAATLDAAWVAAQAGGRIRAQRARILALATAPLVPALALAIVVSARPAEDATGGAVLAVRRDAALAAAVHPLREALATRRQTAVPAPKAVRKAPAPARAKPLIRPARVQAPSPAVAAPKVVTPKTAPVKTARRASTPAPAAPKPKPNPVPVPVAASVPHTKTKAKPAPPATTPPPAGEQQQRPPAVPLVLADEDDDDRGEEKKGRKDKRGHEGRNRGEDEDRGDHEDEDDD